MEMRSRRSPAVVVTIGGAGGRGTFVAPMRQASQRVPLEPSALRAIAASIVGMLAVAIVSATPRSPYYPVLPDGLQASGPLRWSASPRRPISPRR